MASAWNMGGGVRAFVCLADTTTIAVRRVGEYMAVDERGAGGPGDDQEGALLRAILDHTNDVVMLLAADGTIRFASASAKWLLGLDPEEQVGRSGFDFIHHDDLGDVIAALGRSVAAGPGPLPRKVVRVRHGDGTWRWIELSSYGMLDDPLVRGFVVTAREVRERLDAEAGLGDARSLVR